MGRRRRSTAKGEKWIKHYSNVHKILLVGEGDFSFAASLANAFGSASNILATSLDSQVEVEEKYSKAETNLKVLKEMGCTIMHKVDARNMSCNLKLVKHGPFDRIVFNFPHAPIKDWIMEHSLTQIRVHQKLVRGFMKNALEMLSIEGGEVHVTHKTTYPFCEWGIETIAEEVGLLFIEEDMFDKWDYPGYHNRRGYLYGKCDVSFLVGECSTFKFAL
ncbi:uncharacterized protein At4g26485-like [Euphorbia lathyris]|uniref:uncharacterized protein At4g26485-like n=1 Tax=Euphorbia lathyris TaxID=212925 RepID=UPI003314470D